MHSSSWRKTTEAVEGTQPPEGLRSPQMHHKLCDVVINLLCWGGGSVIYSSVSVCGFYLLHISELVHEFFFQ